MKTGYLLITTFLFGSIFGCQGVAQNKSQTNQPTNQNNVAVKSDPLKLKLNNEETGTTADTSALTKKLEEVFKDREDNGIFREGTNEIEKAVHLVADRTVSAEEVAKLAGVLNSFSAFPILIPVENINVRPKPNPLTLLVNAGSRNPPPFFFGIEIGFIGELTDNNNGFPADKTAVAVVVDKSGAYTLEGKQFSATDLETELEKRLTAKPKGKKIVFVQAANFGNMEDVAQIATSAGADKVIFVTKNTSYTQEGMTFSLSPAFVTEKQLSEITDFSSINFKRDVDDSSSFEITLPQELVSKEKADSEIKNDFEATKVDSGDGEVSQTEIDGSLGNLSFNREETYNRAKWVGFRKKDGKYQMVMINFSCRFGYSNPSVEKCAYSRNEFSQIIKSIKFN